MLSEEDNVLLTRVGPGTPMGNLFRRFWLPALLEEEVATMPVALVLREEEPYLEQSGGGVGCGAC